MHPGFGVLGGLECFQVFACRLFDFLCVVCIMQLFSGWRFSLKKGALPTSVKGSILNAQIMNCFQFSLFVFVAIVFSSAFVTDILITRLPLIISCSLENS